MKTGGVLMGLAIAVGGILLISSFRPKKEQSADVIAPGSGFSVPGLNIRFPDFKLPDMTYPNIVFPNISYPDIDFPDRKDIPDLNLRAVEALSPPAVAPPPAPRAPLLEGILDKIKAAVTVAPPPEPSAPPPEPSAPPPEPSASLLEDILDMFKAVVTVAPPLEPSASPSTPSAPQKSLREMLIGDLPDFNLDIAGLDYGAPGFFDMATQGFTRTFQNAIPGLFQNIILNPVPAWYSEEYKEMRRESDIQFARAGLTEVKTYEDLQRLIAANPEVEKEIESMPKLGESGYLEYMLGIR